MGKTLHFAFFSIIQMMMNIDDFNGLPNNEQLRIVFNKAKFVDFLEKDNSVFAPYSMKIFFVELEYDTITFRLSTKRTFESGRELNKYLDW